MKHVVLAALLLPLGCATARAPASTTASPAPAAQATSVRDLQSLPSASPVHPAPTRASPHDERPLGGAVVAPSSTPAPEPTSPPPAPPAPSRNGTAQGGAAPGVAEPDGLIASYEAQLRAAVARISADAATCRDVCGASATICRAAGEICRLTQDADRASPRDPRCRNARLACDDAGQRRDGACPTCPDAR